MAQQGGRPPVDRIKRRIEIYASVAPLILEHGVRGITMREAARAAAISIPGLYYYFDSKQDLVLYGLAPEVLARVCNDLRAEWSEAFLEAGREQRIEIFIDLSLAMREFWRPSFKAALELGGDMFHDTVNAAIDGGMADMKVTLQQIAPEADEETLEGLGRALRRAHFGALLHDDCTAEEMRWEMELLMHHWGFSRETPQSPNDVLGRIRVPTAEPVAARGGQ